MLTHHHFQINSFYLHQLLMLKIELFGEILFLNSEQLYFFGKLCYLTHDLESYSFLLSQIFASKFHKATQLSV